MPILEFDSLSSLEEWVAKFTTPERYMVIVTSDEEVVLQPTKTSRPIIYGYYKGQAQRVLKALEALGYRILHVKSFTWDIERAPGTRIIVE